uniref:Selenoprotein H n=1 Tax=Philothamnus irregularis TaxID=1899461 RepID=A0A0B8RP68_9SAUR
MPPKGRKRKAKIPQAEAAASNGEEASDVKKLPKIRKTEGSGDLRVTIEHCKS